MTHDIYFLKKWRSRCPRQKTTRLGLSNLTGCNMWVLVIYRVCAFPVPTMHITMHIIAPRLRNLLRVFATRWFSACNGVCGGNGKGIPCWKKRQQMPSQRIGGSSCLSRPKRNSAFVPDAAFENAVSCSPALWEKVMYLAARVNAGPLQGFLMKRMRTCWIRREVACASSSRTFWPWFSCTDWASMILAAALAAAAARVGRNSLGST